jgi:hypothetical protein
MPFGSCKNLYFGGKCCLHHQGNKNHIVILRSVRRLPVTANVSSSPILITLMMEAIRSTETSIPTTATRLNIPEDGILHLSFHQRLGSQADLSVSNFLTRCTRFDLYKIPIRLVTSAPFTHYNVYNKGIICNRLKTFDDC